MGGKNKGHFSDEGAFICQDGRQEVGNRLLVINFQPVQVQSLTVEGVPVF